MTVRYAADRHDVLGFIPGDARMVLDVGCASGGFGRSLRQVSPRVSVWGVEPDAERAELAAKVLDRVTHGVFPAVAGELPAATFDCIVFNDVLEHMDHPASALEAARGLLAPGGQVVASIPNIRHLSISGPLLIRGRFEYEEYGILDDTHVRFFTKSSMRALFEGSGWKVLHQEGINRTPALNQGDRRWLRALSILTRRRSDDLFFIQYVICAQPH